eukprot:34185-Heterocapsa_arctica.AAC.1
MSHHAPTSRPRPSCSRRTTNSCRPPFQGRTTLPAAAPRQPTGTARCSGRPPHLPPGARCRGE